MKFMRNGREIVSYLMATNCFKSFNKLIRLFFCAHLCGLSIFTAGLYDLLIYCGVLRLVEVEG